jgi:asparagine synthase (glutamine-hydrolysing)
MWAFAIWDRSEGGFSSQDRFGVKPLFYMNTEKVHLASEIKAILATLNTRPDPNPLVLCDILSGGSADLRDETLYKGIFHMPAGSWIKVDPRGDVQTRKWWETLDHLPEVPKNEAEQVERYRELFTDAVRIRLRSDVPIGSLLSGGMDSSSIVCTIHRSK